MQFYPLTSLLSCLFISQNPSPPALPTPTLPSLPPSSQPTTHSREQKYFLSLSNSIYNQTQDTILQSLFAMGQKLSNGAQQYKYFSKVLGQHITFTSLDLKGAHLFPPKPSDQQVSQHFERCLDQIILEEKKGKVSLLKVDSVWKHRAATKHDEIVGRIRDSNIQSISQRDTVTLEREIQRILPLIISIKHKKDQDYQILNLKNYLQANRCHDIFIRIGGINQILRLMESQQTMNREGIKSSYFNQIQIMRLLKQTQQTSKQKYEQSVIKILNYTHYFLNQLDPINVECSIFAVKLLSKYLIQAPNDFMLQLKAFSVKKRESLPATILHPFIEILEKSNNIIIVNSLVTFVNEIFLSKMNDQNFEDIMNTIKQSYYLNTLKQVQGKIKGGHYHYEQCTFENVKREVNAERSGRRKASMEELGECQGTEVPGEGWEEEDNVLGKKEGKEGTIYLSNKNLFKTYVQKTSEEILKFIEKEPVTVEERKKKFEKQEKLINNTFDEIKSNCKRLDVLKDLAEILIGIQNFDRDKWLELQRTLCAGEVGRLQRVADQDQESGKDRVRDMETIQRLEKEIKDLKQENAFKKPQPREHSRDKSSSKSSNVPVSPGTQSTASIVAKAQQNIRISKLNSSNQTNSLLISTIPPQLPPPPPLRPGSQSEVIYLIEPPMIPAPPPLSFSMSIPIPPPLFLNPLSSKTQSTQENQKSKKQKDKPSIPLKPCLIDTLSHDKIKGSIWESINQQSSTKPYNFTQLQEKYPKKECTPLEPPKPIIPQPKTSFLNFLEPERNKNIQIILLKIQFQKSQNILRSLTTASNYDVSKLDNLKQLRITSEEEIKAKECTLDKETCSKSQYFVSKLVRVPCFRERIQSLLFVQGYMLKIQVLSIKQEKLIEAFDEVRCSGPLQYVLKVALDLSNYLNGQSFKGGAWGFKVSSILKLGEVKNEKGDGTLATDLIRYVSDKYEYPIFEQEWMKKAERLTLSSVEQCTDELKHIRGELQKLRIAVASKDPDDQEDKIDKVCLPVIEEVEQSILDLEAKEGQLMKSFEKCAAYFCEKSLKSEEVGRSLFQCCKFIQESEEKYRLSLAKTRKYQSMFAPKKQFYGTKPDKEESQDQKSLEANNPEEIKKAFSSIVPSAKESMRNSCLEHYTKRYK